MYIQIGYLRKGINPLSIMDLEFGSAYLTTAIKTGIVTGLIALAVSLEHKYPIEFYNTMNNLFLVALDHYDQKKGQGH